jgi:hypothetical protein
VYSEKLLMMDKETVEFYSKNKFEKLVHLVGYIIRIYHDAWSPERQNTCIALSFTNCYNRAKQKRRAYKQEEEGRLTGLVTPTAF